MIDVYPKQANESPEEYQARKDRHDEQQKKLTARDPNIPTVLHEVFEYFEARLARIEARLRLEPLRPSSQPPEADDN